MRVRTSAHDVVVLEKQQEETFPEESPRSNFPTRPNARQESIMTEPGANYRLTILSDGLVRFEWSDDGVFEDQASTFAINRDFATPEFRVIDRKERGFDVVTERFRLSYDKKPFSPGGLTVQVFKDVSLNRWRYGDPAENLGGTARTLDQVDGRLPLEPGILSRAGYAFVDDSETMLFDGKGWVAQRKTGRIDGYLFAYGRNYKAAMRDFYYLSAGTPLLPRWTLGTWWSRFYPYTADDYLTLMDRFKKEEVPLSVAVVDMDWHLRREKVVQEAGSSGWTGYTWNKKLFPDPEKFMKEIHKRQLKITLNDHPADGIFHFEDIYQEMAKTLNHDTSHNDPIEFDISNRDFCNAYYDVLHRGLEKQGVDFWWTDWQQGRNSRIANLDPLWMLNHFSFLDNARNGTRPLHFSRYAGPGSHRYPIGFSGDHVISWASLAFQPEFTATASNIGYGWWSHDIGGHMRGTSDDELQTRWLQFGIFSPIMRLHSSPNVFLQKEPWNSSVESQPIQKHFLQLRHRMLPYLYTMNVRASQGEPICQPMYWQYPYRDEAYAVLNQYYFGSQLLVMPITSPRDVKTRQGTARGWLPPGKHIDIFTEVVYRGDRFIKFHRPLSQYPVLAPQGAIIPLDQNPTPANGCPNLASYEVVIIVGADGEFEICEDDGQDVNIMKTRRIKITWDQSSGRVTIFPTEKVAGFADKIDWKLRFPACAKPCSVLCDFVSGVWESRSTEIAGHGFTVSLGPILVTEGISVNTGKDRRLTDTASAPLLWSALQPAIMEYELKKEIWNILSSDMPRTEQITQLEGLPVEKPMLDVLMEILMADL